MELAPHEIECPNCDRMMRLRGKRRQRLYRHREDMWFCHYSCGNPTCNTTFHLKYAAKSFQQINGVTHNECEY